MAKAFHPCSHVAAVVTLAVSVFALGAEAWASSTVIQLSRQENGYSAPPEYYSGGDAIVYRNLATPTHIEGPARLTLQVFGNFDGASEKLDVFIDDTLVGTALDGPQSGALCHHTTSSMPTQPATVSLTIDADVLAPLIEDGRVEITLKPSHPSPVCQDAENPCYSLRVVSGSFVLRGALSPVDEKTLSAASLTKSRTAVTLSNLPNLSGRLARVSFRSSPTPRAPGPSAPTPSAPTPPPVGGASPPNAGSPGAGIVISGGGTSNVGNFSFSGDFYSMRSAAAAKDIARQVAHYGERRHAAADRNRSRGVSQAVATTADEEELAAAALQSAAFEVFPPEQAFDVWFGGSFSYFDTELGGVGETGGVGSVQMGIDTRVSDDVLLGAAVFGDLLRSDSSTGSQSHGLGVMAGPYAVIGLHDALYLELMAAYGRAFNRINSSGLADARYQSQRVLATARLSGDWVDGPWSIRPSARVTYYEEKQESFDAGDGSVVGEQTAQLGQLRFGPELGHNLSWDGGFARPFMGIEGVWAFKQTEQQIDGAQVAGEDLTGSFSFGLDAVIDGASLRAAGRYDGIGEPTIDAISAEVTLRLPLE